MQLRDYWDLIVKRRVLILVIAGTSVLIALVLSTISTPAYRSTASLFVSLPYGNTPAELSQGSSYTQNQMLSYAQLATMPVVLAPVIDKLELDTTPKELAERVSARSSDESTIMQIQASSSSPILAADIANAIAAQLGVAARDLSPKNADKQPTVDITAVGEAVPPMAAYSPNTKLNLLAALLVGLFLAFALVLLWEKLDTRLRSREDVTGLTDAPLLADFPEERIRDGSHLVMLEFPGSPHAEGFRRLRSNLRFLGLDRRPIVVVVTSSIAGEGKTTVVLNLAIASAQAGDRVLVVDADLRKPSVADYLGIDGGIGLTTILTGEAELKDVVYNYRRAENLDIVTSGVLPPNPTDLLGSQQMTDFIESVRPYYDVILFDTAPLVPVIDAAVLAHSATGAIFVARSQKVRRDQFEHSMQSLAQAGSRVLGVVLNGIPGRTGQSYYGYASEANGHAGRQRETATTAQAKVKGT